MESNKTKLTKKELMSVFWRSNFLQASFNYERFQNIGWAFTMMPVLKKVYKTKEGLSAALKRHLEFFNTHPILITPVAGLIAAMEENQEDPEAVRGIKVALMGPLGGIGDAIIWLTFLPIFAGIGASLAMDGNVAGPIIYLILFNILNFGLKYWGIFYGYNKGLAMLESMGQKTEALSRAASTIGVLVIGSLIASYVKVNVGLTIVAGEASVNLQQGLFDKIMPGMLPLAIALGLYNLMKKKDINIVVAILIILAIGIVGSYTGILA